MDEDVRNLTGTMPRLTVLLLLPLHSRRSESALRTTSQSLVHVLAQCPGMMILGLRFDAANHEWRIPVEFKPRATLQSLLVDDSPITQPNSVALFLSAVISNSQLNLCSSDYSPDPQHANQLRSYSKLWKKVADMHKVMCVVRAHERT